MHPAPSPSTPGAGQPAPPRPLPLRRSTARTLFPALAVAVLTACSTPAPEHREPAGLTWSTTAPNQSLNRFTTVIIRDFKDRVTEGYSNSTLDRRLAKIDQMRLAVRLVPDQLADALRRTGAFPYILRTGTPDAQCLVVEGSIWRFDNGESMIQRDTLNRFGNSQFEVRLELGDGANGAALAKIYGENMPSGSTGGTRGYEPLSNGILRVSEQIAAAIAAAR